MTFILGWALIIIGAAFIAAAMGLLALIGFILGVVAVIAASLIAGLAAASVYDRRRGGEWEDDRWDP